MAIGPDRVQVYKTESTAGGGKDSDRGPYGGPVAINPQQDAIESAGLYLNDESYRDENVAVFRDGSDMKLKDVNNPAGLSLTALAGGGFDPNSIVFDTAGGFVYDNSGLIVTEN